MDIYLYLSLLPEALIASQLPPMDFGNYLAVGTKKRTRGEAMFFEVDRDFKSSAFRLDHLEELCKEHKDGERKCSKYLSIYRVLEHVPVNSLKKLYLVTDDGRVLALDEREFQPKESQELHFYQQIAPVNPSIASRLNPVDFCKFITTSENRIYLPKLVFCELVLQDLATDPLNAPTDDLPYENLAHLRDCLVGLQKQPDKPTKTVTRTKKHDLLYRTIKNGFFVGDQDYFKFYAFPSRQEMEEKYHAWWRSALTVGFH